MQIQADLAGLGMFTDITQALLGNPVDRHLHLWRQDAIAGAQLMSARAKRV